MAEDLVSAVMLGESASMSTAEVLVSAVMLGESASMSTAEVLVSAVSLEELASMSAAQVLVSVILEELALINYQQVDKEMKEVLEKLTGKLEGIQEVLDKAEGGLQVEKKNADKAERGLEVRKENAHDKAETGQVREKIAADEAGSGLQVRKEIATDKVESGLQVGKENAADKAESELQVGKEIAADKAESGLQVQEENAANKAESGQQVGKEIAAEKAESGLQVGKDNAADKVESRLQLGKEITAAKAESGLQVGKKIDAVRDWLKKLKDTSYDIQHKLVECRTLIDKGSRKVLSLTPCDRICFRQDMLHNCAQKIKQLSEKLDSLEKDKPDFSFTIKLERPPTTSTIGVSKVHGRAQDIESLVNELLKESKKPAPIPVISILGMAGIGKTTLAQAVFNNEKVKTHFEKKIWVFVSRPFDNNRMVEEILESLAPKSDESPVSEKKSKVKKFLIILDDVWAVDPSVWKKLKDSLESESNEGCAERESNKGRILVTTRKKDVTENIGSTDIISLQALSQDESWSLFKAQLAISEKTSEELNKKIENIGKKIANKCKGLPLAIMTLGSLLCSETNIKEWQNVADSEMWELKEVQEKIFPSLLSSYFDLPSKLRKIFSYCAVFPKDYEIEKNSLVDLWMTRCYIRKEQIEDAELINDACIEKLATYSFLKNFRKNEFDGSVESFVMYDIMHDFAQFLSKHGWFTEDIDDFEESRVEFSCEKAQHLVLGLARGELFPMHISGGRKVSSLAVRCDRNMNSMTLSKLFGDFPCLRRLFLSDCLNVEKLPRQIKKLIHLQYLDLSRNEWLIELPEALCELHNLETLNLNGCIALKKLPQGIGKLRNLKHLLNCCTYRSLTHLPKGIEKLNGLQTLKEFVASRDRQRIKAGLKCLEKLNNLRGSLDILKLQNVAKKSDQLQKTNLKDMEKLFSLRLDFGWELGDKSRLESPVIEEILEISEVLEAPPPNLKALGIYSYQGKKSSFNWTPLTKLKVLTLNNCVSWEDLPPLGKLSSLESLHISYMESVKKVGDEFLGTGMENISSTVFQNLKILTFSQMAKWEDWVARGRGDEDITIMPCLQSLSIRSCNRLKSLPDYILQIPKGIERLTCLRTLKEFTGDRIRLDVIASLECLKNLNNLQGSLDIFRLGRVANANEVMSANLNIKKNLLSLYLDFGWYGEKKRINRKWIDQEEVFKALEPPPSLGTLGICSFEGKTLSLNWMLTLTNLRVLTLINFSELEFLPSLGKLSSLESLAIQFMKNLKQVGDEIMGIEVENRGTITSSIIVFPNLKNLYFSDMEEWEEWNITIRRVDGIKIMPCLQFLSINFCNKLKGLPDHILQLTTLRELEVRSCDILNSDKLGVFSHRHRGNTIFPNLMELTLSWSDTCERLPPLGNLSSLESLHISLMHSVKIVDSQFLGIETGEKSVIVFHKLKTLTFSHMENWEDWVAGVRGDEDITIMPCLRSLSIRSCNKLKSLPDYILHIPEEIERLTCLRTLKEFIVDRNRLDAIAGLECLKNLDNLQGSLDIFKLGNVVNVDEVKSANLKNKKNLLSLYLDFGGYDEKKRVNREWFHQEEVFKALEPPPNLETLGICSYEGKTLSLNWMLTLTNLRMLTLNNFSKLEFLPSLGKLSSIESLAIQFMKNVKQVGDEIIFPLSTVVFPKLKYLLFSFMGEWEKWTITKRREDGIEIMPCLEVLMIQFCPKLEAVPDQILSKPTLQTLEIIGCPILERLFEKDGEEWRKISHIPEINIPQHPINDSETFSSSVVAHSAKDDNLGGEVDSE